ncbi:MAG: tetratricopeptide repeat protein [Pseudomonadota bacterium]
MKTQLALSGAALALATLLSWLWPRLAEPPDRLDVARELIRAGRAAEAVHLFNDPAWRGVAEYRANRYHRALGEFFKHESITSFYNMGNAYARLHEWRAAKEAYRRALDLDPGHADAVHNLALVLSAEAAQRAQRAAAQTTIQLGQWRDGDRAEPDSDSAGDEETVEDGAAGERTRASTELDGTPGESGSPGLVGAEPINDGGMAGPADTWSGEGAAPDMAPGAGGSAVLRASRQNVEILLGRIRDDPARVLAARLKAAHENRKNGR